MTFIERYAGELKERHDARHRGLIDMTRATIRELSNDYGLPQDLNKTQMIKYILQKEFPSR